MNINKVSVVLDIDGTVCSVLLDDMDEQKRTLFCQTISAFCKEPGTLQVVKLNNDFKFQKLTNEDMMNEST